MKDNLYQQVQMDRSTGIAQSRNPPTSGNIIANSNAAQDMSKSANQTRLMKTAGDMFIGVMPDIPEDALENMTTDLFEDAGEMLDMREIVTLDGYGVEREREGEKEVERGGDRQGQQEQAQGRARYDVEMVEIKSTIKIRDVNVNVIGREYRSRDKISFAGEFEINGKATNSTIRATHDALEGQREALELGGDRQLR
ncbi:hypothetical protein TI39_contig4142g00005 [Zymoseptoria brevis]|uniref:Uncharacterized protein n=1 Tax=Zymoseptoria brevis TaxID=1047168 RepID=A0A0F4GC97_9PEZI|nr:hypothetical protein TI39_contig4142g00005 [Zymoseptoria brevis]